MHSVLPMSTSDAVPNKLNQLRTKQMPTPNIDVAKIAEDAELDIEIAEDAELDIEIAEDAELGNDPIEASDEDGLTNEDLAELEALGNAAVSSGERVKSAKQDDRAANADWRNKVLWCGLQVKTAADKKNLNSVFLRVYPKSQKQRERLSQIINSPAVHQMMIDNNGGVKPETPEDIAEALGYTDKSGNEQIHTMTSLSDGRPNSPITLARNEEKRTTSREKSQERTDEVNRNPATKGAYKQICDIAKELVDKEILSMNLVDGANRSKHDEFLTTNVEMLYEMIHVE